MREKRGRETRKVRHGEKGTEKIKRIRASVSVRYTSIYIKNRSTATIRDLFSSKEPLSDLWEIMWVTTCRIPLITPFLNCLSLAIFLFIEDKRNLDLYTA